MQRPRLLTPNRRRVGGAYHVLLQFSSCTYVFYPLFFLLLLLLILFLLHHLPLFILLSLSYTHSSPLSSVSYPPSSFPVSLPLPSPSSSSRPSPLPLTPLLLPSHFVSSSSFFPCFSSVVFHLVILLSLSSSIIHATISFLSLHIPLLLIPLIFLSP